MATQVTGVTSKIFKKSSESPGEDGVEISVPEDRAEHLVQSLLGSEVGQPALAGLGARDSLRLEAGLCLYGNDITEDTSPIEAGLAWLVTRSRRSRAGFPGAEVILRHLSEGVTRRRGGLVSRGAPARGHTQILDTEGQVVGEVTSGKIMTTSCNL